jgi:hypothetical protein
MPGRRLLCLMQTPRTTCPVCNASAVQYLANSSKDASVDYFLCQWCGQVWNVPKLRSGPVHYVTDPTRARIPIRKPA